MPFVAPKSSATNSANSAAGRTTFRPPWVKDESATTKTNTVPWAKKTTNNNTNNNSTNEKENGEKTTKKLNTTTAKDNTTTTTNKKTAEPAKKATEPAKKIVEPAKKIVAPVKKPTTTTTAKTIAKKKQPTPPPSSSSSEEEESEEEEEETSEEVSEEESEEEETSEEEATDDASDEPSNLQPLQKAVLALKSTPTQNKKKEQESELNRRFSIEKPKLRPVLVTRDKSNKKLNDDNAAFDDQADDDDDLTEEDRERKLRFKLEKPKLRHVKREEKPLPSKSSENILKIRPTLKKVPKIDEILKEPKEQPKPEFKTKTLRKAPSIKREPSIKNVPAPPPLPSLVPKAPPPPPPPLGSVSAAEKRALNEKQKATLEKLKTRPRRRPDWSEMMKEVETGRKLRHVECNDRSQPILTCKSMTKVDDKFIYETEKDNSHNKLLKQIQGGIRLKPTQTNDRSKPILDGLRKFRRQMTIEEQLQKSQSKINMLGDAPTAAGAAASAGAAGKTETAKTKLGGIVTALSIDDPSGDELDDIDKLRDDLQSTKQMLALELRNREAQERENKKLLAKIVTLEAELEREKSREKNLEYGSNVIIATMDPTPATEDYFVKSLKREAEDAKKVSKDLESKYLTTGELLDQAKLEIEEQKQQIKMLEKKLAQALQVCMTPTGRRAQFGFHYAHADDDADFDYAFGQQLPQQQQGGGSLNGSRRASDAHTGRDSSPELDLQSSESDPDEPEEKKQERREKRLVKEVKVLRSKLTKVKVKQEAAKKEKQALKQAMKKNHVILKEEQKKYKKLEKEVQKMAASMKEDDDDEDAEENEKDADDDAEQADEEEEQEAEAESEESEESESEESEAETASESEAEDASNAAKKQNLEPRLKKHETRLTAMKKCNVLLQANVDNLQDEITQVRSKAANLQSELDAVLADLGF